jgi:hypothetical protein
MRSEISRRLRLTAGCAARRAERPAEAISAGGIEHKEIG